jgi:hypothetical protein
MRKQLSQDSRRQLFTEAITHHSWTERDVTEETLGQFTTGSRLSLRGHGHGLGQTRWPDRPSVRQVRVGG